MGQIYLDACLLIYLVEHHPRWAGPVAGAIAQAEEDRPAGQMRMPGRADEARRSGPACLYRAVEQFAPLDMPEPVYLQAAQLRGHFGLRTADALHLACAQYHGCDSLWANDDRLAQASHGLARNILN